MKPDRIVSGADADESAQRLSCMLDGELSAEECAALAERLRGDGEAARRWAMYSCVGDALRSAEVAAWHSEGFVDRVASALEREPTVLAPAALPRPSRLRRWALPGGAAAVAAAILVAVGLPSQRTAAPDAVAARPAEKTLVVAGPEADVVRSRELERYLTAHRELAEPALMPHATPYLRTSGALLQEAR